MADARNSHTATLLPSGKILVAGGRKSNPFLASAELYDPARGTWAVTGSLATTRSDHTATLLPSGKVLVAGGYGFSGYLDSAEVYDPGSGAWTATGSLAAAREGHTATLLPNGKVLVVGGYGSSGYPASAVELYDPETGTWTLTRSLATPRYQHTATLLRSGKVLVAGGRTYSSGALASAELYDPESETWTPTGSLTARREHTATLLSNGSVLVLGGWGGGWLVSAEIYDPESGTWTPTGSLATARYGYTATLLPSGKVLAAGGASTTYLASAELYDPGSRTWTAAGSLAIRRYRHTATLLPGGTVLVAGGGNSYGSLASAELYDPGSGTWEPGGSLASTRYLQTATLLPSGKVLVAGGLGSTGYPPATELYDPGNGAWAVTGSLGNPRYTHTATLLANGKVLVAGGYDNWSVASAELYDPGSGTWAFTGSLATARYNHTATLLPSGKVLVAGGWDADMYQSSSSAEIYDPGSGTWTATGSLTTARWGHTATLLTDGTVLVAGGDNGGYLVSAELYDPATGTWTPTGSLTTARREHTATLLPNGRVLVAGGHNDITGEVASAELYDPRIGAWIATGPLATARSLHRAILLLSGKVLVAGGQNGSSSIASAELFDPGSGIWAATGSLATARRYHTLTLLPSGKVVVAGGYGNGYVILGSAELYDPLGLPLEPDRRPSISSAPSAIEFGSSFNLIGHFRGDSEASQGNTQSSAVNYPIVEVRAVETGKTLTVSPDPRTPPNANFWDDPMSLSFSSLPVELDPGWNLLTVVTAGVPSVSRLVRMACSVAITQQPQSQSVPPNSFATFTVMAQGARSYQWCKGSSVIPGATAATYTTPRVTGPDSGTQYTVVIGGPGCVLEGSNPPSTTITSDPATLTVEDDAPPTVGVASPSAGDIWVVSPASGPPNVQKVQWSMTDNVFLCRERVWLEYSNDGGTTWQEPVSGGLDQTYGALGCGYPGVNGQTSVDYAVPTDFPSGTSGSLYRINVQVWDREGNTALATPPVFYIAKPNPDARTLILWNSARMQSAFGSTTALEAKLQELAAHSRVLGVVDDLSKVAGINQLYAQWDAAEAAWTGDEASMAAAESWANTVLFGCHAPFPQWCQAVFGSEEKNGIHDRLLYLLSIYSGVRYVVLVGDDKILPFARLADGTAGFSSEANYITRDAALSTGGTVARALRANKYLSDDPLGVRGTVTPAGLSAALFIPDLALGRLVERPDEIIKTISTFIGQGGVLDLTDAASHTVLVTGYDWLTDLGVGVGRRWSDQLGSPGSLSTATVDATSLVGQSWGASALRTGLGGERYGVVSLNGHANHFGEGDAVDLGLSTQDIHGTDACATPSQGALSLDGAIVYSVGCHGGLPVRGSCATLSETNLDDSLDLPETMLSRGVVAYLSNTGYGFGLLTGPGYAKRMSLLLTQELTRGGTVVVGNAIVRAKTLYFTNKDSAPDDPYAVKSLMQWTLFGLPMYGVATGIPTGTTSTAPSLQGTDSTGAEILAVKGRETVMTRTASGTSLPPYLTKVDLHFDFSAPGVYQKKDSQGSDVAVSGCPDENGCFYTLNGLSTEKTDTPIQPYFVYDSRLSGTSQHGVLWKGGSYVEETGWTPIYATLATNLGTSEIDFSNHGTAPKKLMTHTTPLRLTPEQDPSSCQVTDAEVNTLVMGAGELVQDSLGSYTIERHYETVDLETLYYNGPSNCYRSGPVFDPSRDPVASPYHVASAGTVSWVVSGLTDSFDQPGRPGSGVWRVLVVYDDEAHHQWVPLELASDGEGNWTGSLGVAGASQLSYVLEAVDVGGNVGWLDYTSPQAPASGVPLSYPYPIDVTVPAPPPVAITGFAPASGLVGATVTIAGQGFACATSVGFAGKAAAFQASSDTSITVLVPLGAVSGPISVTTPWATATSAASFTVITAGPSPFLSIDDVVVTDGTGPVNAIFTVSLSAASGEWVAVDYATEDGTAVAGLDYTAASGALTFPAGATVSFVNVPILTDQTLEPTRTFFVNLAAPVNASIEKARGEGWILDVAPGRKIAFASGTFASTSTSALISVRRSGGTEGTATVHYRTSDGTALAGLDYQAVSGALTFPPGVGTRSFTVPILSPASGRTALLELRDAAGAVVGSPSTAVLTIARPSREQMLRFVTSALVAKESAVQAVVAVTRTGGRRGSVSVDYAASGGTAIPSTDYTSVSGTLDFPDGVQIRTFTVPILDDHVVDDDKTVGLTLSNPVAASLGSPASLTLTIESDDPTLSFSATSYQTSQTAGSALITVERRGPRTSSVSVGYETSGGTGTPGTDYTAVSGTLDFAPGVLVRSFTVPILNDPTPKSDRTVGLTLLSPSPNAGLGVRSTATLLIGTDDPQVFFSKESYQVTESASQALITVARTGATGRAVGVSYQTSAGTATPGEDYLDVSGTLSFPARVVKQSFAVPILEDLSHVSGETVNLSLSSPTGGAVLGTPQTALLTIVEDDQAGSVGFAVSDFSVSETGPTATVTVVRTGGTAGGVSVDYATSDGTALDGGNYLTTSGRLTFADGEMSKSFTIPVLDDGAPGENLTVTLTLSSPTGGLLLGSRSTATLWIVETR